MEIEFQYFNGCPNSEKSLKNLQNLVESRYNNTIKIKMIEVPAPELAEELHFQGSPSILVNGYDLYSKEKPTGYNYSCRIYNLDGKMTGVLPMDFIESRLEEFLEQMDTVGY
ncbi:thioredoxin domain-containing protein [Spirochaeta dissipatitropha]